MQVNGSRKGKLIVLNVPKASANKAKIVQSVVVVKKKKRRSRIGNPQRGLAGTSSAYMNCLTNPFVCPPVRAGFGCLVPSQVRTAYKRSSFTTASDGSFSLFVLPNANNLLLLNLNTLTTVQNGTTGSLNQAQNVTPLNSLVNSTRTLGMGIRLFPMIPATSVPGIISLGCAPRMSLGDAVEGNNGIAAASSAGLFNSSTDVISALPYLKEHIARPSSLDFFQLTWRPTDVRDFEFSDGDASVILATTNVLYAPYYQQTYANQQLANYGDTQGSFLVCTGQGLPASTKIYYEIVLHEEAIASAKTLVNIDVATSGPSLADTGTHSSFESFYRSIQGILPTVDQVSGAATSLMSSPMIKQLATNYARRSFLGVQSSGYEMV